MVSYANQDLESLRKKFVDELMKHEVNKARIIDLMNNIQEKGTWPGINYKDVSNTGFQHAEHLSNLVLLSRAYKHNDSELKGDPKLKKIIYSALDYWL